MYMYDFKAIDNILWRITCSIKLKRIVKIKKVAFYNHMKHVK